MNREFLQEFHLEEPVVEAILEQSGRELADLRFEHLLDAAIGARPRKVVVKRPLKGPFLAGVKPAYQIAGKAVRYDVLVPAQL